MHLIDEREPYKYTWSNKPTKFSKLESFCGFSKKMRKNGKNQNGIQLTYPGTNNCNGQFLSIWINTLNLFNQRLQV